MDNAFAAGEQFLLGQARLLERRLFATCFLGAPATGVVNALRGYQNDDGGFGHGLEPDKRCPVSLPIDVEMAFQALATAGTADRGMVAAACDFLARTPVQRRAGRRASGPRGARSAARRRLAHHLGTAQRSRGPGMARRRHPRRPAHPHVLPSPHRGS